MLKRSKMMSALLSAGLLSTALNVGAARGDEPDAKAEKSGDRVRVEVTETVTSDDNEDPKEKPGKKESKEVRIERRGRVTIVGPDGKVQEFEIPVEGAEWHIDGKDLNVNAEEIKKLMGEKIVRKQMIGVTLGAVSEDLAPHLGLEPGRGAMVLQVRDESPAAKAGLAKSDVITHLNGEDVTDMGALQKQIEESAGKALNLTVIHAGKSRDVSITSEEMEAPTILFHMLGKEGDKLPPEARKKLMMLHDMEGKGGVTLFGSGIHLPADVAEIHAKAAELQAQADQAHAQAAHAQVQAEQARAHAVEMQKLAAQMEQMRIELKELRDLIKANREEK